MMAFEFCGNVLDIVGGISILRQVNVQVHLELKWTQN